jgi:hypothetical protein
MAQWLKKDDEQHRPPPKLLDFSPSDWVLGASNNPARLQMALDHWYQARWDWVIQDPENRTIDGDDVIEILFERRENRTSSARF